MTKKRTFRWKSTLAAPALALLLQTVAPPEASATPHNPNPQTLASRNASEPTDILVQLSAVPGLSVTEQVSRIPGTRIFHLRLEQPVDHRDPEGRRFSQFMTLLHRSTTAPMVMITSGYAVVPIVRETPLTGMLQGNQLYVEHRFFGESIPQPATYEHLNIQQAASDIHRVVEALKPVYTGKWVSSATSKGGMTGVYHRYFYPDDVVATLANGAPSNHGPSDERYVHFIDTVGDAACREQLREIQKAALRRREEMLPLMAETAEDWSTSFHWLGVDRAFEFGVLEFPFYFWQMLGLPSCSKLPSPDAPAAELFAFIDSASAFALSFDDLSIEYYGPYYYQAATQLGAPLYDESHLQGLLHYPGEDVPSIYSPVPVTQPFEYSIMRKVENWVRKDAQRMIFIYGQNDPWSARPFEVRERNDSYRFYVPDGDHTANITQLTEADRQFVLDRLSTWLGVEPATAYVVTEPPPSRLFRRAEQ
ncbi:S28 family serine protease [Archangium minus]